MSRTGLLLLLTAAAATMGQAQILMRVRQVDRVFTITSGGTTGIASSSITAPLVSTFTGRYQGQSKLEIQSITLDGSTAFKRTDAAATPIILTPGTEFSFDITYTPKTTSLATGVVLISYAETFTSGTAFGVFVINLQGGIPDPVVAYAYTGVATQNVISDGSTIPFPETRVTTGSVTPTLVISNRGSAPLSIKRIALGKGTEYQLLGVPLLPGELNPSETLSVGIKFSPKEGGERQDTLLVEMADKVFNFALSGLATQPVLSYSVSGDLGNAVLTPGGQTEFPVSDVGDSKRMIVTVANSGTASADITAIQVSGLGLSLSNLPFLPLTLAAGKQASFTVTFAPTDANPIAGRLRVGDDTFELRLPVAGGSRSLTYSYRVVGSVLPLLQDGLITFPSTRVGASSTVNVIIRNGGSAEATVAGIAILAGAYRITSALNLPVTISPGAQYEFTITFQPTVQGSNPGSLRIGASQFVLAGDAGTPEPLAPYRIDLSSATVQALSQPSLSITLIRAYASELKGTLTMTFVPDSGAFGNDQAVQFSTGGRTVSFTIPAGSLQATFPDQSTTMRFQSGTVSGTLAFSAQFSSNGVAVPESTTTRASMVIQPAAPRILDVQITSSTSTGIVVSVTGVTTTRSLTTMSLTLAAASGYKLNQTQFDVALAGPSQAWFQSASSANAGGVFVASVTLNLRPEQALTDRLPVDAIQSIAVKVANSVGSSESVTLQTR